MYESVEKTTDKKSQMKANGVSHRQNSNAPTSRFVDNRPEAIQMRKLRELAKTSPQNAKLRGFHNLAAAHSVTQKKSDGKQGFGFVDNRPEAVSQGKINVIQRVSKGDLQLNQTYQKGMMKNPLYEYVGMQDDQYKFKASNDTILEVDEQGLTQFKIPKQKAAQKNPLTQVALDVPDIVKEKEFDHAQAKVKLDEEFGAMDAFTGGDTIVDQSKINEGNKKKWGTGAEMKSLEKYEIDGKVYVKASIPSGQKDSKFKNLGREAKALSVLHYAGLDVPKVYRSIANMEDKSGVNFANEPFILMDFIPGTAIDLWKNPDGATEILKNRLNQATSINEIFKIKSGLEKISRYLQKHIVVDLQIILGKETGRVVIIDPIKIYKLDDTGAEKHISKQKRTTQTIKQLIEQINQVLESRWKKTIAKGEYPETNAKVGRSGSGVDRATQGQQEALKSR